MKALLYIVLGALTLLAGLYAVFRFTKGRPATDPGRADVAAQAAAGLTVTAPAQAPAIKKGTDAGGVLKGAGALLNTGGDVLQSFGVRF